MTLIKSNRFERMNTKEKSLMPLMRQGGFIEEIARKLIRRTCGRHTLELTEKYCTDKSKYYEIAEMVEKGKSYMETISGVINPYKHDDYMCMTDEKEKETYLDRVANYAAKNDNSKTERRWQQAGLKPYIKAELNPLPSLDKEVGMLYMEYHYNEEEMWQIGEFQCDEDTLANIIHNFRTAVGCAVFSNKSKIKTKPPINRKEK